jgi:hypothetical protein
MDGSSRKPVRAVRQQPRNAPANRRFGGVAPNAYTEKLVIEGTALAPPPPLPYPPDNLLKASVKALPVAFSVALPLNADFGDVVQLELNGAPVDSAILVDPFIDTGLMVIPLSAAARASIPEGTVLINYVLQFLSGEGEYERGPQSQSYRTDYTAPGEPLLGRLLFSEEAVKNGVTPAALVEDNGVEYLPALVPSYKGLEPGDVVTGTVNSRSEVIDAITVVDGQIELRFLRDFIEAESDGPVDFSYNVVDRAGNVSKPSEIVTLQVLLKGALPDLIAPRVPAFDDDTGNKLITEADARADTGLLVEIPLDAGIVAGDLVVVHWGATDLAATPVRPGVDPVATVGVPYATVSETWAASSAGADQPATVAVSYDVLRGSIVAGTSPANTVAVNLYQAGGVDPDPETPINENLVAPTLTSDSGQENDIPPEDFDKAASITVSWQTVGPPVEPVFLEDDIVTVFYGSASLAPLKITDPLPTDDLSFTLPAATIGTVGSGEIELSYRIDRLLQSGETNAAYSPITIVTVHGADELPGGGSLPAGRMPEAIDSVDPTRLLIGKSKAKDGTDFIIPPYKNQKADDIVTVTMRVFRSFYGSGHPADRPPADDRDIIDRLVTGPFDPTKEITVHFTEVDLMRYEFATQSLHAHVTYTIAASATPDRKVTSDVLLVDLDPRGDI